MARKEAPLDVRIPSPAEDRPVLSRVGIVAIVGFAIGIAWPKLVGVKLGPDAPGSRDPEPAAATAPAAPEPSTSAAAAPAEAPAEGDAAGPTNKQRAVLTSLTLERCREAKGKKREGQGDGGCAPIAAERWIEPRVRSLATCPSSIGLEGDLAIELDLDFEKKAIRVDQAGKSAFPTSTVRGVLKCAGDEMETLELDKIAHTQPRVTLVAKVTFVPPGKALEKPAAPGEAEAADGAGEAGLGSATVTWEKALLRDAPKDGKVVARVPQGSRVKILEQRDDWYLVSPPKGDTKGWVYRQAIGK